MNPEVPGAEAGQETKPRTCGDEPEEYVRLQDMWLKTPHMRG